MALIGVDSYAPSPGTTGASASVSTQASATQTNAPATATISGGTTTAQAGPQPLKTAGALGTNVNVVA